MNNLIDLKERAEIAKYEFKIGLIDYDRCKELIMPYINLANEKSKELAKKYNQKTKKITFTAYIR